MSRATAVVVSALIVLSMVATTASVATPAPAPAPDRRAVDSAAGSGPAVVRGGESERAGIAADSGESEVPATARAAGLGTRTASTTWGHFEPRASFKIRPDEPAVRTSVEFNASASFDPDGGDLTEYVWTVDGDRIGKGETIQYTIRSDDVSETPYGDRLRLDVKLNVTDNENDRATLKRVVYVEPGADLSGIPTEDFGVADGVTVDTFETEKPVRGFEIPFLSGPVVPEAGLDQAVTETDRETVWTVVQFDGAPSKTELDQLDELGYRQRSAIADDAYYAGIPPENAPDVANLDAVRAVADVEPEWKVAPRLADRIEEGERFRVSVRSFEGIDDRADTLGLEKVRERTYRGSLTGTEIRNLQDDGAVQWIEPFRSPEPTVAEGRRMVAAERVELPGINGSGVRVGVVDTGIDHDHPHFSDVRLIDNFDKNDSDYYPEADRFDWVYNSHGTHVAGTIAGSSRVDSREIEGVAPNATLVIARGLGADQFGRVTDNDTEIISNSWGGSTGGQYANRVAFVDRWARSHPQQLLVAAYGNYNTSNPNEQFADAPGIAKNVLSVGSLNDATKDIDNRRKFKRNIDNVNNVAWLNNLTQPEDGRQKPDVNAPGAWITSSVPNGTYASFVGSSMATPHVSGIAALYEDAFAWRDPDANEVKSAIVATAGPVENPKPSERPEGYGAADAHNAIYNNSYESRNVRYRGVLRPPIPTANKHFFDVTDDAEKVVVSLSWLDPAGTPATRDTLVNDLDLYVGPVGDPKQYSVTDRDQSINRLVIDDIPAADRGQQWVVTVKPHDMWNGFGRDKPKQEYDGNIRVVTEKPELSISAPDRIVIEPHQRTAAAFDVEVDATGAPVHGVRATVDRPELVLEDCWRQGTNATAFVIGTLSADYSSEWDRQLCFEVPSKFPGTYNVTFTLNTTNAATVSGGEDGPRPQNASKNVTLVVPEPTIHVEPYLHNASVGENVTYRIVASNVSQGVDEFRFRAEMRDPSVGRFVGASTTDSFDDVNVSDGGSTLEVEADPIFYREWGNLTLATVVAQGESVGTSDIGVEFQKLEDGSFNEEPLTFEDPDAQAVLNVSTGDSGDSGEGTTGADLPNRTLSSADVGPGGDVTVTVTANVTNGSALTVRDFFDPAVASASVDRVAVDGEPAETILRRAETGGVVVTLGDSAVDAGQTVTVEYTISVSERAALGSSYEITGSVVSGETRTLPTETVTVREQDPVFRYDEDGNGAIDIGELGGAAADYAAGEIDIATLGQLAASYVTS